MGTVRANDGKIRGLGAEPCQRSTKLRWPKELKSDSTAKTTWLFIDSCPTNPI